MSETPFNPPLWLRPTMVQTGLASLKLRRRGTHAMEACAQERILNCGPADDSENVRLMGSYSRAAENKALVIFLHGWEGSQDSTYVVSCARQMFERGASVFRLNFRDHGDTHHLNEGLFLSTRFDEVLEGVKHAAELAGDAPVYLVGFSLGGNFSLRIARALKREKALKLAHIVSISPVVNPHLAAPIVDQHPLIKRYFKKKLMATMEKNMALYPERYDFTEAMQMDTILDISEAIIPTESGHDSLDGYFEDYRIADDDLQDCPAPVSLIMADDDPVVPAAHLDNLKVNADGHIIRLRYGGHNGFFQSLLGPTWYDDYIKRVIFS